MPAHSLSDRQERFVYEYLIDQNASAAAARAGYSGKTKGGTGAALLKKPAVRERVTLELGDLYAQLKVTALEVMRRQVNAAYFDPLKMVDAQEAPLALHEMDEETRSALTVSFDKRHGGETVMRVKQTPRHLAMAALVRRFENYEKLRELVLAQGAREEAALAEARAVREAAREAARAEREAPLPVLDVPSWRGRGKDEEGTAQANAAQVEGGSEAATGAAAQVDGVVNANAHANVNAGANAVAEADAGAAEEAKREDQAGAAPAATPAATPVATPAAAASSAAPAPDAAFAATNLADASEPMVQARVQALMALDGPARLRRNARTATLLGAKVAADVSQVAQGQEKPQSTQKPGAGAQTAEAEKSAAAAYNFRDDPDWMWGGKRAPTPEPEMHPEVMERMIQARLQEQREELLRHFAPIRPGAPPPAKVDPGYNPPWARRNRPQYAIGGGECSFDGYGDD